MKAAKNRKGSGIPASLEAAAMIARDKKAFDIMALDVRGLTGVTDFFIIASVRSKVQMRTVADEIEKELMKSNERCMHRDGRHSADLSWYLMDYSNFMVHLFLPETRRFYDLERLYEKAVLVMHYF